MNNQRSNSEQIFMFLALALGAMLIYNQFLGHPNKGNAGPLRPVPAISQAFAGLNVQNSPGSKAITTTEAQTEKIKLDKDITNNGEDDYSYWARLRAGLLEQYVLDPKDNKFAFKYYDEIAKHSAANDVDAQALYQKGDWLWRESTTTGTHQPSQEAATTLEQLVHRGRGSSSEFLDTQIYVPNAAPNGATSANGVPPQGFRLVKIRDLNGTLRNPNPEGILDRVNEYYSHTTYYQIFDAAVKIAGANPAYSYGLVILCFAIFTRLVLQPLNKKQYESIKGMQVIAPEMKKIQDKYKGKSDQQGQVQMMKEIQDLQKRHGVNPMMGCGLALVQMPIFFLVVSPFIQHYEAKMELAGASFLWIHSLAGPDMALLIMYGISMFFSFRLSSAPPTDETQRQQQMIMSFMMPIMFPFFLKTWPSAFTLYWMTFNVLSTIFQYRMMKAADPTKSVVKSLLSAPAAPAPVLPEPVPPRPKSNGTDASKNGNKNNGSAKPKSIAATNGTAPLAPVNGQGTPTNTNGDTPWTDDDDPLDCAIEGTEDDSEPMTSVPRATANGSFSPNGRTESAEAQNRRNNPQRTRRRRRY